MPLSAVPSYTVVETPGLPRRIRLDDGYFIPVFFDIQKYFDTVNYEPEPADLFIATPPKCGTTWTQNISYLLLNEGEPFNGDSITGISPFIEETGPQILQDLPEPRIIKTHLPFDRVPFNDKAKYIYVIRNPKDVVNSFYHHTRGYWFYNWKDGKFNQFFDIWMRGEHDFGDYFEHLRGWLPAAKLPNVLLLRYEDMLADHVGAMKKIAKFLGGKAQAAAENPEILDKVVRNSLFDTMAKEQKKWCIQSDKWPKDLAPFLRKGQVGDWRNTLSKEQSDAIDKRYQEVLGNTEAADWWKEEMQWQVMDIGA
jgi:hypothetical protein